MTKINRQTGMSLFEITIVLIIFGLLLGAVLKGQSMIQNTRTKSLIAEKDKIVSAYNLFIDRYRALPGDYASASTAFGCGDGQCFNGNGNGTIDDGENVAVWQHLISAKFLNGDLAYDGNPPNSLNSLVNPFGGIMKIENGGIYDPPTAKRHVLHFGSLIPVEVLAEVDRKIDDGLPFRGRFEFSKYSSDGINPSVATCIADSAWYIEGGETNCGALWIL